MKAGNAFLVKFASSIIAVLGCHDRVIFKGHLPFSDEAHLNRFVDHTLRIRRKDFLAFAAEKSERLVTSAKGFAAQHGAPYVYLQGRHRKEDLVQQQIRERRLSEGLVCVLCNQGVKGSEKFWSEAGSEAVLQLRADQLSDGAILADFWERRQAAATGQRRYRRAG
jgi:hypothetical protein